MADSDFDNITPAEIKLTDRTPVPEASGAAPPPLGTDEIKRRDEARRKQSLLLLGIFVVLLVLVGGVVFVLPRFITPPDPAASRVVVVNPKPDTAAPANEVSPFEEAQKLRQREAAQNVLADLLDLQESLEDKKVASWAEDEINQVYALAKQGDEAYRSQEFINAQDLYKQGLDILTALDNDLPNVFNRYMATGGQAILDGDPDLAEESFGLAVLINPDSEDAVTGYDRAQRLGDVLALVDKGREQHDAGKLEEAREYYKQALEKDPAHIGAKKLLDQVNTDILDRDFSQAMSEGFSALAGNDTDKAEAAFKQALSLKPGSPEANEALEQTQSRKASTAINARLEQAGAFEADENWQQAMQAYDEALGIDPNLVKAKEGKSRANSRNNLDIYLKAINADPLRLAEDAVFEQAVGIYNEAVRIDPAGPRLSGQLQTLRGYLEKVDDPVEVTLQSDGLTDVTVYKVGALGQFTSHSMNLTPGTYVAVGVRDGYRDVRKEFVVGFDGKSPVISVQCDEEVP